MRLIKLLAYALLGYVIYEFAQGVLSEAEAASSRSAEQPTGRRSRSSSGQGRRLTGNRPGGLSVSVQDAGGGTSTRTVGRGVVS